MTTFSPQDFAAKKVRQVAMVGHHQSACEIVPDPGPSWGNQALRMFKITYWRVAAAMKWD